MVYHIITLPIMMPLCIIILMRILWSTYNGLPFSCNFKYECTMVHHTYLLTIPVLKYFRTLTFNLLLNLIHSYPYSTSSGRIIPHFSKKTLFPKTIFYFIAVQFFPVMARSSPKLAGCAPGKFNFS